MKYTIDLYATINEDEFRDAVGDWAFDQDPPEMRDWNIETDIRRDEVVLEISAEIRKPLLEVVEDLFWNDIPLGGSTRTWKATAEREDDGTIRITGKVASDDE